MVNIKAIHCLHLEDMNPLSETFVFYKEYDNVNDCIDRKYMKFLFTKSKNGDVLANSEDCLVLWQRCKKR